MATPLSTKSDELDREYQLDEEHRRNIRDELEHDEPHHPNGTLPTEPSINVSPPPPQHSSIRNASRDFIARQQNNVDSHPSNSRPNRYPQHTNHHRPRRTTHSNNQQFQAHTSGFAPIGAAFCGGFETPIAAASPDLSFASLAESDKKGFERSRIFDMLINASWELDSPKAVDQSVLTLVRRHLGVRSIDDRHLADIARLYSESEQMQTLTLNATQQALLKAAELMCIDSQRALWMIMYNIESFPPEDDQQFRRMFQALKHIAMGLYTATQARVEQLKPFSRQAHRVAQAEAQLSNVFGRKGYLVQGMTMTPAKQSSTDQVTLIFDRFSGKKSGRDDGNWRKSDSHRDDGNWRKFDSNRDAHSSDVSGRQNGGRYNGKKHSNFHASNGGNAPA